MMTETPRTDAAAIGFARVLVDHGTPENPKFQTTELVPADFARKLERELSEARKVEIRTDPGGALDEIVGPGVHLEQMSDNSWFLSVGEVNVWLNAKGKIAATYEGNRGAAG